MTGFNLIQDQIMVELILQERLREAEMERLVRLARSKRPRQSYRVCAALAWLGKQLVNWGTQLQKQYGPTSMLPNGANKLTG
jgi:hypothetical protein